jgi:hypothetical protein
VLKHVKADHDVEGIVADAQRLDVFLAVHLLGEQVGGDVGVWFLLQHETANGSLRREMENIPALDESLLARGKAEQAMSFERAALGTIDVASVGVSVAEKLSAISAERTLPRKFPKGTPDRAQQVLE